MIFFSFDNIEPLFINIEILIHETNTNQYLSQYDFRSSESSGKDGKPDSWFLFNSYKLK